MFVKASDGAVINDSIDDQDRTPKRTCRSHPDRQKTAGVFLNTLSTRAYKEIKKNGEFVLPGFGKLVKQKRKARTGFNPKTQKKIRIPPRPSSNFVLPRPQRTRFWG